MADTIYYVNTASTAGGDGTTNATTGANRAYPTLYAFEAARQTTISSGNRIIVYCDGGKDNTSVTFGGWTINGQLIITAHANSKHIGVLNLNKYYYSNQITINESNITFDGLQFYQDTTSTTSLYLASASINPTVKNCIFRGRGNGSGYAVRSVFSKAGTTLICNNIFYDIEIALALVNTSTSSTDLVFNNTIVNKTGELLNSAINLSGASNYFISNNLIKGSFTAGAYVDSSTGMTPTTAKNITSDTTSPNGLGSKTITFVDEANADFHLSSSDTSGALAGGLDLSVFFTTDIDDQTRSTWTIGADEFVPGLTTFTSDTGLLFLFNDGGNRATSAGIQTLGTKDSDSKYDGRNLIASSRNQWFKTTTTDTAKRIGYTWSSDLSPDYFIITRADKLNTKESNTVDLQVYSDGWITLDDAIDTTDLVGNYKQDLVIPIGVE